jgi:predicted MPP superfamily phosphohydrolase
MPGAFFMVILSKEIARMARFVVFLAVFLSIYAAMHVLVFFGVRPLLPQRAHAGSWLALLMVLMILAPALVRVLDRNGMEDAARTMAMAGYSWMGFIFLAFVLFAALFCWDGALLATSRLFPRAPALVLYGPKTAAVILLLTTGFCLYGITEAGHLRTETVRIKTGKLPAGVDRLRLIQISDLHLGLIHRQVFLKEVTDRIKELHPDIVVATGDIVDAQINHLDGLAEIFASLRPPLGKYAVTGNHEFYAGLDQALDFIRRGGFVVLREATATPGGVVQLTGVDDPAGGGDPDETPLLKGLEPGRFTVLLKHRPRVRQQAEGLFDLQLSGHAHRGQIFPFNFVTGIPYPMQEGLYTLAEGSRLYTSRGTGTWGPPMRLLAPPEITVFDIVPEP